MKLQSRPFEDASAVVIGASLAGLATASLLSRYFGEVLVLEKDPEPAGPLARRGVPQGTHVHGLQGHALTLLESLLPGLRSSLVSAGPKPRLFAAAHSGR